MFSHTFSSGSLTAQSVIGRSQLNAHLLVATVIVNEQLDEWREALCFRRHQDLSIYRAEQFAGVRLRPPSRPTFVISLQAPFGGSPQSALEGAKLVVKAVNSVQLPPHHQWAAEHPQLDGESGSDYLDRILQCVAHVAVLICFPRFPDALQLPRRVDSVPALRGF